MNNHITGTNPVKLYDHQTEALNRMNECANFALFHEMGTGKTLTAIKSIEARMEHKPNLKVLIVSPLVTLRNWQNEIAKYSAIPSSIVSVISGTANQKAKQLADSNIQIYITNYESLLSDAVFAGLAKFGADYIIADEMHSIKNHKSKRTKALLALRAKATFTLGLTGTPILNRVDDLFSQFLFLDSGRTFGSNYWVFRSKYLTDVNARWANSTNYFPKFETNKSMVPELNAKLSTISTNVRKLDVLKNLPPLVVIDREVELSAEQKRLYKEMKNDCLAFLTEVQDFREVSVANIAMTKIMRLQQIVSGHLTGSEGQVLGINGNPRLDACLEIIQEITDCKNQIIVWTSFSYDVKLICNALTQLGITFSQLTGEITDKQAEIDAFTSGQTQVMVANRRAGGIGINLVNANYSVVYSRNFSLADELQSEARNHRGGSEIHTSITKINLVAKGTVDEEILTSLKAKEDLGSNVLRIMNKIKESK